MVNKIYELKNQVLEHVSKSVQERGIANVNVQEMGLLVDIVKDLAEAEKNCWEADYYREVTNAMSSNYGYTTPHRVNDGRVHYNTRYSDDWPEPYAAETVRRGYSSLGYQDHIDALKTKMQNSSPQEREQMQQELRGLGMM